MTDDEITLLVGWPTEPEMVKFRRVAAAAEAAERERCDTLARIALDEAREGHWAHAAELLTRLSDGPNDSISGHQRPARKGEK